MALKKKKKDLKHAPTKTDKTKVRAVICSSVSWQTFVHLSTWWYTTNAGSYLCLRTLTLHPWLTFGNRDGFIAPEAKFSVAQSELHTQAPTQSSRSKKLVGWTRAASSATKRTPLNWVEGSVCFSSLNYPENDVWAIAVRTISVGRWRMDPSAVLSAD